MIRSGLGLGLGLGRLSVLQGLEGIWILRIFVIFLFPTFSRSIYLFLAVSRSYHAVSGDLENQGQLPVLGVI